ncbi:MAG: peptidylprolyl isomerase [Gammaproteobacteria bacterium]|nr:peptidylprolyl isomerase [Gammaproteobacteria bacterium]MDH4254474.1 peptidylprolyl isomerase [Gammaproteobacteria bacterium]MDH5309078.1 peptidylprolyl isomerase [Gammaproteobacteria bacterium]
MNRSTGSRSGWFLPVVAASLLTGAVAADADVGAVRVLMETEYGDIVIEVYPDRAPVTAGNFLRYVDGGHYDGATFYRTVTYENDNGNPKIEVIQGGIGDAEAPYEPIAHETTEQTGIRHTDGVISMGRGDVGTAASEFFICIGDQPGLDFGESRNPDMQGFAAFGRVLSGMEAVHRIHALPSDAPADNAYLEGQMIESPAVIRRAQRQ